MNSQFNKDTKVKTPKSHSQDSIPSFIRKTYDILDERRFPDVIDWNTEGTALVIKKPTEFCQKVLPTYFKHNNLTSFVRQLNMYNFHKRRTQNLDHIYHHELFQKGKKHLLKEIRRKGADHSSAEKTQKTVETPEVDAQQGQDLNTLTYENEFLKRLYNEAMSKLNALEAQVNEMTNQNQSLWSQVNQKSQRSSILKPLFDKYEKQPELTLEQLPMTFSSQLSIPPLNMAQSHQEFAKPACVNSYFCLGEEITESTATEVSQGSPSLVQTIESDKCFDMSEVAYLPALSLTPQVSQVEMARPRNDLFISRGDMSVGQLFDAWGSEQMTQEAFQDSGLLGKRPLEQSGDMRFNFAEPALKRNDLSVFNKKGMFSAGIEDRDMFKMTCGDEFEVNMGIDLMDFTSPFCGWTKTA